MPKKKKRRAAREWKRPQKGSLLSLLLSGYYILLLWSSLAVVVVWLFIRRTGEINEEKCQPDLLSISTSPHPPRPLWPQLVVACALFGQLCWLCFGLCFGFMAFGVSVSLRSGNVIKITTGHAGSRRQKAAFGQTGVENLNKMWQMVFYLINWLNRLSCNGIAHEPSATKRPPAISLTLCSRIWHLWP